MKEFRLTAWPQLRAPYDRIAFRRLLSEMSQRHLTLDQLVAASGLRRPEIRAFLDMLGGAGLLSEREAERRSLLQNVRSGLRRGLHRVGVAAGRGARTPHSRFGH